LLIVLCLLTLSISYLRTYAMIKLIMCLFNEGTQTDRKATRESPFADR